MSTVGGVKGDTRNVDYSTYNAGLRHIGVSSGLRLRVGGRNPESCKRRAQDVGCPQS